jgi:hypothetical protein
MLLAFASKQIRRVRRLRPVALPAALALVLSVFALVQLPSANTLWLQEGGFTGTVSTGTWETCKPLGISYVAATQSGGNTTYVYNFTGGGQPSKDCKNLSYVALPVCFNPEMVSKHGDGLVVATVQPGGWRYDPQNGGSLGNRVKWSAAGSVGSGPFAATFSFTLAGTNIPLESVQSQTHAGSGSDPVDSGSVQVPHPASCDAKTLKVDAAVPSLAAPGAITDVSTGDTPEADGTDSTPVAGSSTTAPAATSTPSPTATPVPTLAPRPTAIKPSATFNGVAIADDTPVSK